MNCEWIEEADYKMLFNENKDLKKYIYEKETKFVASFSQK